MSRYGVLMTKDEKIKALQKELARALLFSEYGNQGFIKDFWICCNRDKKLSHKKSCKVGKLLEP